MMKKKIPLILVSLFFSFSSQADLRGPEVLCGNTNWPQPNQVPLFYCQPGPNASKQVEFCVYGVEGGSLGFDLASTSEHNPHISYQAFSLEQLTHNDESSFVLDNKDFGLFRGHQIKFYIDKVNWTGSYRYYHYERVPINDQYGTTDYRATGLECLPVVY